MNSNSIVYKIFSLFFVFYFIQTSTPTFAQEYSYYHVSPTNKDTCVDFDNFLSRCTLEERIALMQALRGVNIDIEDEYFGNLDKLPSLNSFATDKKKASQTLPLKPETFNEVLPVTVMDAINKGYLESTMFTPQKIKRELIWRRYNKVNYFLHEKDNIDYHNDIVKWCAKKNKISNYNFLSTYEMEKQIALKYFEKIWDKLDSKQRQELLAKIEKETGYTFENKAAIALQSGAIAITALSATVAFMGFQFYITMSTVICTVAGIFGVTLPFTAYTSISTTFAILSGPIGWCIAGLATVGSAFLWGMREPDTVAAFVITANSIKAKWLNYDY